MVHHAVENVFDEHPQVRRTALVGVGPRDDQTAIPGFPIDARHNSREQIA